MLTPTAIVNKAEIDAAIAEIMSEMAPDIVRIRFNFSSDWSGDPAIYFRTVISDDASRHRRSEVTEQVRSWFDRRFDFLGMGFFAYYSFRSVSSQATVNEPDWE